MLEHLTFRSENRFQPVIEALAVIKQSLGTKGQYFPADVPVDGIVLPSWRDTVIEEHEGTTRINRQYYELCVLQRLERALKCKEIWVCAILDEGRLWYHLRGISRRESSVTG